MQRTNLLLGCALLVFALVALIWLIPTHTIPASSELDISAGFMPYLACSVIAVLSGSLALRAFLAGRRNQIQDESDNDEFHEEVTGLTRHEAANLLIWTVYAALGLAGLVYLGFHMTAPLLLAAAMYYTGCRNHWVVGIVSLLAPIVISQIVWQAFTVRMPEGHLTALFN